MDMVEENRGNPPMSSQVSLLMALLMRYPHLSNVHYNGNEDTIRFVFFLREMPPALWTDTKASLMAHREAYADLVGISLGLMKLHQVSLGEVAQLEVERDVKTLTRGELHVVVTVLQQMVGPYILCEEGCEEEEVMVHDELIDMLLTQQEVAPTESFIGFREKGKVLVFSHSPQRAAEA